MLDSALRQRTLTALLLAPLAVAAVLLLPTPYVAFLLGLVILLGTWEWTALAGMASLSGRSAYLLLAVAALYLLWTAPLRHAFGYLLIPVSLWWLGLAAYLFRLRAVEAVRGLDLSLLPIGLAVLLGPWVAVTHLHSVSGDGPRLVLFLLILIWTADTAAYFTGRQWGRAKLAPVLSPGKTRVGVYGALGGAALCGIALAWMLELPLGLSLFAVALCALTAFISVVGDLYESLLKRRRGLKDSGHLLPGHGGVLDRIDSLTAAAPLFTLGVLWLEAQI